MVERTKGAATQKPTVRKEELSKQLGREGRGPKNPGVVAPPTSAGCRGNCWWDGTYTAGGVLSRRHRRRIVGLLSSFCFLVLMMSVILRQRPPRQSDDVKPSASSHDFLEDRPVHSRRMQYAGRLSHIAVLAIRESEIRDILVI